MSVPLITYVGGADDGYGVNPMSGGFVDQHEPVPGKSEWGMDTLTRTVRGLQTYVKSYAASLAQGAIYVVSGVSYYLQSWEPDSNPVFPGFTLHYKGLVGGIPLPKASGQNIEQTVSIAASNVPGYTTQPVNPDDPNSARIPLVYTSAERTIRYITRQANTLYITTQRPATATYGVDVDQPVKIINSIIRAEAASGSYVFNGGTAPAGLVIALTPALIIESFVRCSPVVGSPYFECEDTATKLYKGD